MGSHNERGETSCLNLRLAKEHSKHVPDWLGEVHSPLLQLAGNINKFFPLLARWAINSRVATQSYAFLLFPCLVPGNSQNSCEQLSAAYLGLALQQDGCIFVASKTGEIPSTKGQWHTLQSTFALIHLGQEVTGGAGRGEDLRAQRVGWQQSRGGGEDMLRGWQDGDHMPSRGITLGEGLHGSGDTCAGGQCWVSMGKRRCGVVVICISVFLRLDLDDAGGAEAEGRRGH